MVGNPSEAPSQSHVRAVQISRFGGPEVLAVVDLPDPVPGDGIGQLYEVSSAGVDYADTRHALSANGPHGRTPQLL